ncbi:MAG: hypothetical protein WDA65_05245 [Christensenellales bacterium]
MKKAVSVIILSVFIAAAFFPAAAFANDSVLEVQVGRTVYPVYDTDVEMEEEIIDIVVRDGCSYVNCQFFFHNTGESTDLLVGFPSDKQLNWFRTFINGRRVPVKVKKGFKHETAVDEDELELLYYPKWYTWRMHFSADERIKVVNKYWMSNLWEEIDFGEIIYYILRSGATWKGNIGKITIRMRLEGYKFENIYFYDMEPTYIEEDGTIVWTAENIKPEKDIVLEAYHDSCSQGVGNPFDERTRKFDKYRKMGNRLLRNFYAGGYNGVTWWGNKFFKAFEDKQSSGLYYYMGVSYYKLGYNEKALEMFGHAEKEKDIYYIMSAYYKALICKEAGDNEGYLYNTNILKEYNALADSAYEEGYVLEFSGMWVKSRLSDLRE